MGKRNVKLFLNMPAHVDEYRGADHESFCLRGELVRSPIAENGASGYGGTGRRLLRQRNGNWERSRNRDLTREDCDKDLANDLATEGCGEEVAGRDRGER